MMHGRVVDENMANTILEYLPEGGTAADLGCGSGRFCSILLRKAAKVYCVDIDEYAINLARENVKDDRATFLVESAESTSIPSSSVDLVIMVNSFHDMDNKAKVAEEVYRILKPGGHVVIIETKPGSWMHGPPPWIRMSPEEVMRYFDDKLFSKVEVRDLRNFNAIIMAKKASSS